MYMLKVIPHYLRKLFKIGKTEKKEQKPKVCLPGKVSPVLVEWDDAAGSDGTYLEAHQILVGLIERLRQNQDQDVQVAIAWAEKALWGETG